MRSEARGATGDGRRERGLTLVEVVVSLSVLSVLFLIILRSTVTVGDSSATLQSHNTIMIETRKAMTRIHSDIATSRKVYEENALGRSYLDAMNFSLPFGNVPPVSTGLLPAIANLGDFDKDVIGDRRTGNILLMVGEMAPHDYLETTTMKTYRVSVFRLICYYLGDYGSPVTPGLSSFDLLRWESAAFVDHSTLTAALNNIADPVVQENLVDSLVTGKKITYAWDPTAAADSAFYELTTTLSGTPDPAFNIPWCRVADNTQERMPVSYYRRRNAAVAPNNEFTGEAAVPKFAQKVAGSPAFPNGFEVMIIGPSGARKVKVRLVAERAIRGRVVTGKSESIATMRDL